MMEFLTRLFRGAPAPGRDAGPRIQARFDSGTTGSHRTRGWNPPDLGAVAATSTAPIIRSRARDGFRNDSLARQIVETWIDDVCGWGFVPRSSSRDASVRSRVNALWETWSETAGAAGEDFAGLTAAVVRSVLVDGEAFVRLRTRRPEDGLVVPLAIELIDSARIPFELTEQLEGGSIVQGIERDLLGRVTAYYVLDTSPGEPSPANASTGPRRIPAASMLHVFDAERPGQVRGVSILATALPRLRMLDGWHDATLLRQQLANLFAGFVTSAVTPDGMDASVLTGRAADATQDGRPVVELEPGILQELAAGEKVEFSDPPDPPRAQDFGREQARLACLSAGVPLEVVTGDWGGANDRIARVTLNAWRRRIERFRWSTVVPQLLRPVWSAWTQRAGLGLDVADRGATWRAHAWPYVHPVQDVQASIAAIRGGLTSLGAVVAEASGEDSETVLEAIAADNRLADELGLRLDSDGRAKATP